MTRGFQSTRIVASNSINEQVLLALQRHGAVIDAYGIGTNLVTAEGEPALGGVYKLVELDGSPRIKISQDPSEGYHSRTQARVPSGGTGGGIIWRM